MSDDREVGGVRSHRGVPPPPAASGRRGRHPGPRCRGQGVGGADRRGVPRCVRRPGERAPLVDAATPTLPSRRAPGVHHRLVRRAASPFPRRLDRAPRRPRHRQRPRRDGRSPGVAVGRLRHRGGLRDRRAAGDRRATWPTAAAEAGVAIVTGDTKVVGKGAADGLYITTAGVGVLPPDRRPRRRSRPAGRRRARVGHDRRSRHGGDAGPRRPGARGRHPVRHGPARRARRGRAARRSVDTVDARPDPRRRGDDVQRAGPGHPSGDRARRGGAADRRRGGRRVRPPRHRPAVRGQRGQGRRGRPAGGSRRRAGGDARPPARRRRRPDRRGREPSPRASWCCSRRSAAPGSSTCSSAIPCRASAEDAAWTAPASGSRGPCRGWASGPSSIATRSSSGSSASSSTTAAACSSTWRASPHGSSELVRRLAEDPPPLARVAGVTTERLEPTGRTDGFRIVESEGGGAPAVPVSIDSATCADCLAEVFDPADRRYRYPFTNCTNCGPRYTIVLGVPYDRPATTMARFRDVRRLPGGVRRSRRTGASTPSPTPARAAARG